MANYQDASLDPLFHALSDATRRAVVAQLTEGSAPVKILAAPHDMALPSFMKHIDVLERAKLIRTEKLGRQRMCHLEGQTLRVAQHWLEEHRAIWEHRLNRLDALVQSLENGPKN